jgi:putative hemolysin
MTKSMMTTLQIIAVGIFVLLAFSAFFSASETALFSIPRERIVIFRRAQSRRRQWVYELIHHGQRTLLMILLGNLFVNITLAGLIHTFLQIVLPGYTTLLTMVVATGIIVIFGEMMPKNIALKNNETIACLIAPAMAGLTFVCSPLLLLIYHINSFFLTRFRMRLHRPSPFVTIDEMKSGVIASHNSGAISTQEQDMIVRLLDRGSQPVRNFMVHRSHLVLMPREALCEEALKTLQRVHQLFVLVYNKTNTGQVIGMVHLGTLIRCAPTLPLYEVVKPLQWISAGMEVAEAIELLFEKGSPDAGIIDEYGSFCGVFSLSTGLRSVVAPLFNPPSKPCLPAGGKTKLINGDTVVETMAGWLPPSLEKRAHQARTVNGLLTGYLGFIPQSGDKFAIDGWNFYIISASPVKIGSVLIRKKEAL